MDRDDLIQKYLHSELTDEELIAFENLVENDAEFAEEVELRSIFYADRSAQLKNELEQSLLNKDRAFSVQKNENFTEQKLDSDSVNETKTRNLFFYLKRVAAVFVFGVFVYGFLQYLNPSTDQHTLAQTYLSEKHDAPSVMMDDSDKQEEQWALAIKAYQEGKYKIAADQIKSIIDPSNPQKEHQLYLGLSYLYQNPPKYSNAAEQFENILSSKNKTRKDEARWYASLIYLETNKQELAKKYLTQIVKEQSWQYKKAQKLLAFLD